MSYCAKSNIEDIFGVANVIKWSQLDPDLIVADAARIARAIAVADAEIDDAFRDTKYAVPLTGTSGSLPVTVVDWGAKLAGIWLYQSRGQSDTSEEADKYGDMREAVDKSMELYLTGQRQLAATESDAGDPTAPVVVS